MITVQQLDMANAALLDRFAGQTIRESSLLKVLIFDHQVLDERALLNYQIEHRGVSGISLKHYHFDPSVLSEFDLEEVWATWTLPIDCVSGIWFVASAYMLSPFVRRYWSDKLRGEVVWYVVPMGDLEETVVGLESLGQADKGRVAAV